MAGLYAADGSWNVTVVDGSLAVGFYADDGSMNVIQSDGSAGPLVDPCGAIRVTLVLSAAKRYADDGSLNVTESPYVEGGPLKVTAVSGSFGAAIQLSGSQAVSEAATSGTAIGTLSVLNGSGSYTFTITADPDSKFAINVDGTTLETAATLDYETATDHSVTIEADNGVDTPISRVFTISVSNVATAILTSPTDTETGSTTADLAVTTDRADGTLYVVVTTSSTSPSAAQVKAGQNHLGAAATFSDNQAIASTGTKTFNATGLSASTAYYTYFMHERLPNEQSAVSASDGFNTEAGSGEDLPHFTILF